MGPSSSDSPPLPHRGDTTGLRPRDTGRYLELLVVVGRGFLTVTLAGVRPFAFWGAVLLPLLYLPSLYGLGTGQDTALFVELVGWHVGAIVLGHGHTPFWSR